MKFLKINIEDWQNWKTQFLIRPFWIFFWWKSIKPTNQRTNPSKFHEKILRIGGAGKWGFFEAAILNFLSRPFWKFFCFILVKNPALSYEISFFFCTMDVFPESWKRRVADFYAHDCINTSIMRETQAIFIVFQV